MDSVLLLVLSLVLFVVAAFIDSVRGVRLGWLAAAAFVLAQLV